MYYMRSLNDARAVCHHLHFGIVLYAVCWSDPFNSSQNEIIWMNRAYGRKWSLFCRRSQTRHSNHAIEHRYYPNEWFVSLLLIKCNTEILVWQWAMETAELNSYIVKYVSLWRWRQILKWHKRLFMGNLFEKIQSKSVGDYVPAIFRIFIVSRRVSFLCRQPDIFIELERCISMLFIFREFVFNQWLSWWLWFLFRFLRTGNQQQHAIFIYSWHFALNQFSI